MYTQENQDDYAEIAAQVKSLCKEMNLSSKELLSKVKSVNILKEQLNFAAYHDSMTNLYNRACFEKNIKQAVEYSDNTGKKIGLILLDLDNLNEINDSQGHNAGDEQIRLSGKLLQKLNKNTITTYRFGGDEFLLLAENLESKENIITISDTILELFSANDISISGGISIYPDDTRDTEEMLKFADMAMTEVKHNHKNNICFFHQLMKEKFLNKINIESRIQEAIEKQLFQLYYQPQFDIATGELRGFEALLRWHDEELGWISPEQFIPLAEESRLIIPLGTWIIETAITTLKRWEEQFAFKGILSVNVSPIQLQRPNFIDTFSSFVYSSGINPAHLEVEITEGVLIDNMEDTINKLNIIRSMGIGVSLDDFGTGYSSLSYLQILPLTTLKIDKSFISSIDSKSGIEANITNCIVTMVTNMGLETIAEGVETNDQLSVLKKINCKNIQGFLKGKPMPLFTCEKVLGGDSSAYLTIKDENLA